LNFLKKIFKNKIFRVTALLIVLLVPFTSDYRVVFVHGESMLPTYRHLEVVIEEKASSLGKLWKPKRGDVVVVVTGDKEKLIKRVIGLEGEYLKIKNGRIYIDDKKYQDSYTNQDITYWVEAEEVRATKPKSEWLFLNSQQKVGVVPKGSVWVIGDNRHESWMGFVKMEEIEGKVLY
jgi:signal peptidase I